MNSRWAKLEAWLLTILVLSMTALATAQVFMRNLLDGGWPWVDLAVRKMVFAVAFMGGSLAAYRGKHLAVDALGHYLRGRAKAWVGRGTDLVAFVVAGLLAFHGGVFYWEIEREFIYLVLPVGFGLMSLRFLVRALLPQEAG